MTWMQRSMNCRIAMASLELFISCSAHLSMTLLVGILKTNIMHSSDLLVWYYSDLEACQARLAELLQQQQLTPFLPPPPPLQQTICQAIVVVVQADGERVPFHSWPLSNTSLYNDTIGNNDVIHDKNKVCFLFVSGPPDLGYSALKLSDEGGNLDMVLAEHSVLKDLSISMYIYPYDEVSELSGTLLHYMYEDREIMKIRCLANTFLVSFRDEYGMSAGMMYLVEFLKSNQWNHVIVTRDYKTGTITVYRDGELMYDEDDDFSDIISFPNGGKLRIGKSQDPDDVDPFDGNFACVQIYTNVLGEDDIMKTKEFCKITDKEVYYKEENGKSCLTTPPPPPEEIIVGDTVSMTTLTKESHWIAFLDHFGLTDSGRTNQNFRLQSRDKMSDSGAALIGRFNATNTKICSRLCMRVDTCQSFIVEPEQGDGQSHPCSLFSDTPLKFKESSGAKFYVIRV